MRGRSHVSGIEHLKTHQFFYFHVKEIFSYTFLILLFKTISKEALENRIDFTTSI